MVELRRIMRNHNDLPQGFQIFATSHCYNEKCYNWRWKWAARSRAGLLCTWRLPAANRKKKSSVSFVKVSVEISANLTGRIPNTTVTHAHFQCISALQVLITVTDYDLNTVSTGVKTDKPLLVANYFKGSFAQKMKIKWFKCVLTHWNRWWSTWIETQMPYK